MEEEYYLEVFDENEEPIISLNFKEFDEAKKILQTMEILNPRCWASITQVKYENVYSKVTMRHEKVYQGETVILCKERQIINERLEVEE